jgi:hypothetical protein
MGAKFLRQINIGKESTKGMAVAATAILRGLLSVSDSWTQHKPDENLGSLIRPYRSVKVATDVALSFEGDATFEQLAYFLRMGVLGGLNPASANPTFAKKLITSTYTDLTNAIDGAAGTSETVTFAAYATDKLYIASASKFRAIRIDMGATVNAQALNLTVKCSNGSGGWLACTLVRDTTKDSGGTKPLAQDGVIEFTPNTAWASDTVDSDTGYWIEISFSANPTASLVFNDIYTIPMESVWTFTPAKTAAGTFDAYTIEAGDDVQAVEVEYCMASKITISGGMAAPVTVTVDMFGRQVANTTFTSGLTPPTVETILGQKAKLYIDAETGTMGATEKSNSLISWTYTIETGLYAKRYGNGHIYFTAYGEKGAKATLQVTAAFNSDINTERASMDGETQRLVRVEAEGTTISASAKKLTMDICGVYMPGSFKLLDERDGEDIVTFTIESMDSPTYGKGFEVTITNALATMA